MGPQGIVPEVVALRQSYLGPQGLEAMALLAMRCRLEPVKKAAKTVKNHLWGIINAVVLKVSNGPAESININSDRNRVNCLTINQT